MKQILFGIFAHPDDEAFGPSAYLYKSAQAGHDVHLLLVTDGEAGTNKGYENLRKIRLAEWRQSGKIIGAVSQAAFHFPDGKLSNNLYETIYSALYKQVERITSGYDEPIQIEFLTFEPRGITGHLDHIAVSYITTLLYERLRVGHTDAVAYSALRYFCLSRDIVSQAKTDWVYMPRGYNEEEIHEVVDFSDMLETKLEIMRAHESQRDDMNIIVKLYGLDEQPSHATHTQEHFILYAND